MITRTLTLTLTLTAHGYLPWPNAAPKFDPGHNSACGFFSRRVRVEEKGIYTGVAWVDALLLYRRHVLCFCAVEEKVPVVKRGGTEGISGQLGYM